jgi:hypothetical protein
VGVPGGRGVVVVVGVAVLEQPAANNRVLASKEIIKTKHSFFTMFFS